MDVDGISIAKAQEIADSSIVAGEINEAGYLVLTNAGGTESNAGLVVPALPELVRVEFFDEFDLIDPEGAFTLWTPADGAKWHHIQAIGGGGGGGAGEDDGSDTASGAGGGGGGWDECWLPAAALLSVPELRVVVGPGGLGGVGSGSPGDDGWYTQLYAYDAGSVSAILVANGGKGGTSGDAAGGGGDTGTPGAAGNLFGGSGSPGKNNFAVPDYLASQIALRGGGGGGGGLNTGSGAGTQSGGPGGGSNGGAIPMNTLAGQAAFYLALRQGGGGGRGGGCAANEPTKGADGGLYGGGGGGGAGANGNITDGGNGAPGCMVIATYF